MLNTFKNKMLPFIVQVLMTHHYPEKRFSQMEEEKLEHLKPQIRTQENYLSVQEKVL